MASRRVVEMGNPPSRVVEYRPSGLRDESKAWVVFAWEQPQVGQGHGRVAGFREYGPIGWKLGNWFFWAGKDPAIVSKIAKHYDAKVEREWDFNERDFHVPFRDSFWGHLKARTQLNFVKSDGSAYDSAWTFQRNGPKWIQSMGEGNLYQPQQFSREVIWMERSRDALNTPQVAVDEAIEIAEREADPAVPNEAMVRRRAQEREWDEFTPGLLAGLAVLGLGVALGRKRDRENGVG